MELPENKRYNISIWIGNLENLLEQPKGLFRLDVCGVDSEQRLSIPYLSVFFAKTLPEKISESEMNIVFVLTWQYLRKIKFMQSEQSKNST